MKKSHGMEHKFSKINLIHGNISDYCVQQKNKKYGEILTDQVFTQTWQHDNSVYNFHNTHNTVLLKYFLPTDGKIYVWKEIQKNHIHPLPEKI